MDIFRGTGCLLLVFRLDYNLQRKAIEIVFIYIDKAQKFHKKNDSQVFFLCSSTGYRKCYNR